MTVNPGVPNNGLPRAIARNVRRLRTARGWSLDTLAARSEVSRGMLIQIEQARTNPSIGTLNRIGDALGVSVAHLVDISDAPAVRVVPASAAVPLWREGEAGRVTLLIGSESPVMELWDWRLGPGQAHDSEAHVAGTTELVHVLEGELTLVVEDEEFRLLTGDSATFRGDRDHRYANEGTNPLRFVLAVGIPVSR